MFRNVRDVMTAGAVTVAPEATLREVAEVLSNAHISGVPVVAAGGGVMGVISAADLMEFIASSPGVPTARADQTEWGEFTEPDAAFDPEEEDDNSRYFLDLWEDAGADLLERFRDVDGPEWNVLEEHTAAEVMSRRLVEISPDADLGTAARAMLDNGVHRLLVVESGTLEGVVTAHDLMGVLARLGDENAVEEFPPLITIDDEC